MKAADVRRLSEEELTQRLRDTLDEIFRLKFQLISGQLQNHRRIRIAKRDIAKMKTIIQERKLKINQGKTEEK